MTEIKSISPLISQITLRNLGMYASERLSVDIYYMLEAIHILIADIGEENLTKMYKEEGKDWKKTKDKLLEISKLIAKVKTFYDPIQNKAFERKDADKMISLTQARFKKYFKKTASKVVLLQPELYEIFVFLIKHTTLQRQQITSESFKILEHIGFRKLAIDKKPTQQPQQSYDQQSPQNY